MDTMEQLYIIHNNNTENYTCRYILRTGAHTHESTTYIKLEKVLLELAMGVVCDYI